MTDPAPGSARPYGGPYHRAAAAACARAVGIVVALVVAYYLVPLDTRSTTGTVLLLVCGLLAVLLVFGWEARMILRSPHPRLKAVEALAATVALYLVVFASLYHVLEHDAPGSFTEPLTRTDALYFTLTTFTTVGFGDITARSEASRVAVMCQMVCGLLLVGVAVRLLAAVVDAGLRRRGRGP
ncbi:two pore domain potassium channel family protein [Streptomyces misionensis]|uniref:Two pore domain potassium channel family protein n=1 Tax=Streptomyces misionensis TaxID=67331 RepID=A0A5C6IRY8_9ACTN|nr:ion channel [Streptomyces misionensis]TWV31272.1 two pore domain potassium channel family protein [Streptomyces misionensis]